MASTITKDNNSAPSAIVDELVADFPGPAQVAKRPGHSVHIDEEPRALHLTPCTFTRYAELPQGDREKYDLVDGLLVFSPRMGDNLHERIVSYIISKAQVLHATKKAYITIYGRGKVYIPSRRRALEAQFGEVFDDSGSPTSSPGGSSSSGKSDTVREPDVSIGKYRDDRAMESTAGEQSKTIRFGKNVDPPVLVFEVTSPSTRNIDLDDKWRAYRRANIEEYVIVDRGGVGGKDACVIVGKLHGRSDKDGDRQASGDPTITTRASGSSPMYHRKIYRGNESVICRIFSREDKITVKELLNPPSGTKVIAYELQHRDTKIAKKDAKITEKDAKIRKITKERDEALAFVDRLENEKMQNKRGRNDRSPDNTGASGSKDKNDSPSSSPNKKKGRSGQGSTKGRGGSGK
ncbi:unnamed protein product [Chondrus crispus]|uniref:Putative restriction endonuclease domain-containing protein n=1 Tax=Chondrus crispus TaxID=2769 RepID=R7QSS8_CHOCR|nr:unnamed protein product [Chondrus crispus]CDF41194.1 unnamed protein product [Chondrus crispus]|eukprot:XP_005711488.1 unnamed protein product [Chondrus crispus]